MPREYDWTWNKHTHIRLSARALDGSRSLFFPMPPWTPAIRNMHGRVSYYNKKRIERARLRLRGVNKKRYLARIVDRLLRGTAADKDRVAQICGFVSDALYYNPIQQPDATDKGDLITDPIELLELHDARCGQGVEVTLALLDAAGIEARRRNVFHHVTCEARYDGRWRLADALMFGANQPERDGEVVNVALLRREPYYADQFPLRCFVYTPEEVLSQDGYRLLGYCFGEWGSLTYYSWYMGGDEDYPPTLPIPLPPIRKNRGRVLLRWAPSAKRNGGGVRYRLRICRDRERTETILEKTLTKTEFFWSVPEENRMYFIGVTAIDDHLQKNPRTWYPEAPGNFVLVPKGQYGWYGVL